jgi:hypothetical protein
VGVGVCTYGCVGVGMGVGVGVRMWICTYPCVYVLLCLCVYMWCMSTCVYVDICACVFALVCILVCVCVLKPHAHCIVQAAGSGRCSYMCGCVNVRLQ